MACILFLYPTDTFIYGDIIKMNNQHAEVFHRNKLNPILTADNWPYPINSVFNAGATLLPDGTTLLLCRVEDRRGLSHFCAARSANGTDLSLIHISEPTRRTPISY